MEKAKVYFTDFHTVAFGDGLPAKLKKLIRAAGIGQIDMDGKFAAIKMHFGELGNISFLRPNYAKAVADVVKELGGHPFLTDCNTLYPGSRKNALEHLYLSLIHISVDVADLKPLFHIQKALWNKPYNILLIYFGNMPAMQLFKFIQIKRVFLFSIFFLFRRRGRFR